MSGGLHDEHLECTYRADLADWARERAERLLAPLGQRWTHVRAVASRAGDVARILAPAERPVLIAAALLHDIGYAPSLRKTGLHQLDGAHYLRSEGHERLARLVAHHSGARFELHEAGFADALTDFPRECSATADALTYCDVTTAPDGRPVSLAERVADVCRRHTDGPLVRSLARSVPYLSIEVRRTEQRLRQSVHRCD